MSVTSAVTLAPIARPTWGYSKRGSVGVLRPEGGRTMSCRCVECCVQLWRSRCGGMTKAPPSMGGAFGRSWQSRRGYAASPASALLGGALAFGVRRRVVLAWASMTSCSTSEVA